MHIKDYFNKHGYNFDGVSKNGYSWFSRFWNKDYDVVISIHDITNKILLGDSNYTVDLVMWAKFGNSSISAREVIITSI